MELTHSVTTVKENCHAAITSLLNSHFSKVFIKQARLIIWSIFAINLSFYVVGLLTNRSSLGLNLLLFLLLSFLTILWINRLTDQNQQHLLFCTVASLTVVIDAVANRFIFDWLTLYPWLSLLVLIINGLFLAIILKLIAQSDPIEEYIYQIKTRGFLKDADPDNQPQPGDVVLGIDYQTHEQVIQPLDDRFVHTQVFGPTGAGKTSQVLLPMIRSDMLQSNIHSGEKVFDTMGQIVLEPKSDLAEQTFRMGSILGNYDEQNVDNPFEFRGHKFYYFNPMLVNTPTFNPLQGDTETATNNIADTLTSFNADSSSFFKDNGEVLVRNAMQVVKRLKGNDATLIDLEHVLTDAGGLGEQLVKEFLKLPPANDSDQKAMSDIGAWFLNDYYSGIKGGMGSSPIYKNTSAVRNVISKLNSNKYLRRALNPAPGKGSDIDFEKILANGDKIAISTAQGALGEQLSQYLGMFFILQIEVATLHRPGTPDTRRPVVLYLDEFQTFASKNFENMLTQGRSYKVITVLATQTRDLIADKASQGLLNTLDTNARTIIVCPGGNAKDSEYFSHIFGSKRQLIEKKTVSQSTGLGKFFGGKTPTESVSEQELDQPIFTPDQVRFGISIYDKRHIGEDVHSFGQIFCCMVRDKSVQPGRVLEIQYIPQDLYHKLTPYVDFFKKHCEINAHTGYPDEYDPQILSFPQEPQNTEQELPTDNTTPQPVNQDSDVKQQPAYDHPEQVKTPLVDGDQEIVDQAVSETPAPPAEAQSSTVEVDPTTNVKKDPEAAHKIPTIKW